MNEINITYTGLDALESELNKLPEAARKAIERISEKIEDAWKFSIGEAGGIKTGAMLNAVEARNFLHGNQSALDFVVSTESDKSVTYSGYYEEGVPSRNYEGRYVAKRAIGILDARDFVSSAFDAEIDRVLSSAKG